MRHFITERKILLLSAVALLGACASGGPALHEHSVTFGEAVAQNKAAQAVAPTPSQKANTFIPADRARQALARQKYRENKVAEPKPISTTND